MRLTEIPVIRPEAIVRDGAFRSVGFVIHPRPDILVPLYDPRYVEAFEKAEHVACVIATRELAQKVRASQGLVIDDDPGTMLYRVHTHLALNTDFYGADFATEIDPSARIDASAHIAPKSVRIGPNTVIEPNATILERTTIGADVIIRAGCVIGAQGFGVRDIDGKRTNVPHSGGVVIEDNVEILSNSIVCKGTFGAFTTIGRDTKLSAGIYLGHNVVIGQRCLVAASASIAGSVTLGNDVWVGTNATISNGLAVGDGAAVSIGAVVTKNVPANVRVSGNFAIEHKKFLGFLKSIR